MQCILFRSYLYLKIEVIHIIMNLQNMLKKKTTTTKNTCCTKIHKFVFQKCTFLKVRMYNFRQHILSNLMV